MVKKKRVPSKYVYKLYTIPEELNNDILALKLSKMQYEKIIHFVGVLKKKAFQQGGDFSFPVMLPKNYLSTFLSSNYARYTNLLDSAKIVIRDDYYNQSKSISKSYSLNNKYFPIDNNNINKGVKNKIKLVSISCKRISAKLSPDTEDIIREAKKELNTLKIDENLVRIASQKCIDDISIEDFKTRTQISEQKFQVRMFVGAELKNRWITKEDALELARLNGKELIQDKKAFYIMTPEEFIARKKLMTQISHEDAITRLVKKYWTVSRNTTNNRLDTNLTNLASPILDVIMELNNLSQIDLGNSQFALLASTLPSDLVHPTTLEFKDAAATGVLYELVQSKLNLTSRKRAKQATFELLFSSHKNKSEDLSKMRVEFPEVMDYIDTFKIKNGHKNFSISLQKIESDLFIDNILRQLSSLSLGCLTKHDSVICKKEDLGEVLGIMNLIFKSKNIKGNLVY
jgi:hypothetical protein